jgi:predicted DNA-binding protein
MKAYKVLLPPDLAEAIDRESSRDDRSPSEYIRLIVERWMFGIAPRVAAENALKVRGPRTRRVSIKASVRNSLFERDGGKCAYCKGQLLYDEPWHIDHIKPVSKGGTNDPTNLVLACVRCNLEKSDRDAA